MNNINDLFWEEGVDSGRVAYLGGGVYFGRAR